MIKRALTSIALVATLGSCASVPEHPPLDVIRNHALNTTEVPAHGDSWNLLLPPNYVVVKHDFDMQGEDLVAKSLFTIGEEAIFVAVSAIPWGVTDDKKLAVDAANADLQEVEGFESLLEPKEMTLGGNSGTLIIAKIGDEIVFQFVIVRPPHAYVLRCTGDDNVRTRVGYRCKNLADRFEPIGAPQVTPLVPPTQPK